jgi:hypothetical protein
MSSSKARQEMFEHAAGSASFQVLSVAKSLSSYPSTAPAGWRWHWDNKSTEIVYWQASPKKKTPTALGNGSEENRAI